MKSIRFGVIGLDTSHVTAFADLLHAPAHKHHVAGGRIVAAFPGGSPDIDLSINRVEGFKRELVDQHNVKIVESIADLQPHCDAILLESLDGRVHLEQFKQVVEWKLPVFIDKPLAVSSADAREIALLSAQHGTPTMTASAIRFAEPFVDSLGHPEDGAVVAADFFGPMALVEKIPGYFWYGIHSAEMLYATLGKGCREVIAYREGDYDLIVAKWANGRTATLRGSRGDNYAFGGTIHRQAKSRPFDVSTTTKPYYASLLGEILKFATSDISAIPMDESVEVIRFLEAANESAATGRLICL